MAMLIGLRAKEICPERIGKLSRQRCISGDRQCHGKENGLIPSYKELPGLVASGEASASECYILTERPEFVVFVLLHVVSSKLDPCDGRRISLIKRARN